MPYDCGNNGWPELREGNADALSVLYRDHYLGLLNYGMKLTGDHDITRDCITQMLLNLHKNHQNLPEVANVRSYLLTCLRNEIHAFIRSGKRAQFYDPATLNELNAVRSYEDYIIDQQSEKEHRDRLRAAFAKLSAREKELLKLRFFEDRSYESIADNCGISKRTAYNIVHMAIRRLKDILTQPSRSKIICFWLLCSLGYNSL